ncbi:MAG: transketolase [Actinomycetota bacterium]
MSPLETKPSYGSELDLLCINSIRTLAMDAVEAANSGHPGTPMALAPAAYVLWTRFLRHNPDDSRWPGRDRFVLSVGHASMLIYSLLYLSGYNLSLDDLKAFRQWGSRTPGHPEYEITGLLETTTGPLGQGFGNGVGMAIAERVLAEQFNRPDFPIVDHFTYAFCSDGDLMEGISHEAASLAGHLRLGKLVYIYDDNRITIDGSTDLAFTENVGRRFEGYHWHVQGVEDGNDLDAIAAAITAARDDPRPSLVILRTHIAYGAPTKQDTAAAHGAALGAEEVRGAKINLGCDPDAEFFVPEAALTRWRQALDRGASRQAEWEKLFARYRDAYPQEAAELERRLSGELPEGWDEDLPVVSPDKGGMATRKASQMAINALAPRVPELIGGSADLTESNLTDIKGGGALSAGKIGRNLHFGVREHGMGGILNGMILHGGLRPFGGTFLIFSDYMRPSIRLAALMEQAVIYVFTHDSIGLGEDGPTHQPVEHLASLRAMPHLMVMRPGDANETMQAWRFALAHRGGPVALSLTRQNLPTLDRSRYASAEGVQKGAYILYDPPPHDAERAAPDLILIATGSEVWVAVEAAERLVSDGVRARVVSMPCWELFERQSQSYREQVLPRSVRARISVEAAATFGWERWIGEDGEAIGIDRFGASAPGGRAMKEFGFHSDHVIARARDLLARLQADASPTRRLTRE